MVNKLCSSNKVNRRRARLVLGLLTVCTWIYHLIM